ncbi:carboxypeptidase B-like [Penaeus japonicus]|uniref:carboxypeptidase B-like n=1 Tax=Penaeus japonicus TaxID=27405 RepID=UPI001C716614|nr:carboxypeptidase B-like [Penaeus japonicus]
MQRAKKIKKQYLRSIKKERRRKMKGSNPSFKKTKKKKNARMNKKKPFVLMEGGAHAREWISPAVATYLAQQLADSGASFLRRVTVVLVPLLNPDGYEFSHTDDRMWRKNRRVNADSSCRGVDLNRNFGKAFGKPSGSSKNPCSEIYHGAQEFSEPEASALRDLAEVLKDDINIYFSLHSYGKYILYPWSYISASAPTRIQLRNIAKTMSKYFRSNGYKGFQHGQSSILYKAAGVSDDYMYSLGVEYTYTIELQGLDFIMNPKHIVPVSEAMWNVLVCSIGDISKVKQIQNFCGKQLVKTRLGDGTLVSGWFKKGVDVKKAEQVIRCRHRAKKGRQSHSVDGRCGSEKLGNE